MIGGNTADKPLSSNDWRTVFPRFPPEAVAAAHLGLVQAVQQIAARLGATPGQIALARRARTSCQFPGPADSSGSRRTSAPQTSSSRPRISPNSTASPLRTRSGRPLPRADAAPHRPADRQAAHSPRWRPTGRPPLGVDSFAYGVGTMLIPSSEDTSSPGQGVNRSRGWPLQRVVGGAVPRAVQVVPEGHLRPLREHGTGRPRPVRRTAHEHPRGRAHQRVTPLHARRRDRDDLPPAGFGGGGNAAGRAGDQLELGVQLPAIRLQQTVVFARRS